ncbi:hypothetical protein [Solidesulfovibrio sp.]
MEYEQVVEKAVVEFERVKFYHRLVDAVSGVFHGLFLFYRYYDPIKQYKIFLRKIVAARRMRLDGVLYEMSVQKKMYSNLFMSLDYDELVAKIVALEVDKRGKDQELTEFQEQEQRQDREFDKEFKKAHERYDRWNDELGRCAYGEVFDLDKLFRANKDESKVLEKNSGDGWFIRLCKWLINNFLYYSVPVEVAFTYPAFSFITPNEEWFVLFGALVLVGAIYVSGELLGAVLVRSRTCKIEDVVGGDGGSKTIVSRISWMYSVLTVVVFAVGMSIVVAGASLRAIVYDIDAKTKEVKQQEENLMKSNSRLIDAMKRGGSGKESEIFSQISGIKESVNGAKERLNDVRKNMDLFGTADGRVAIALYVVLFMASFLRYILLRDPFYDYYLAAHAAFILANIKEEREKVRALAINGFRASIREIDKELQSARSVKDIRDKKKSDSGGPGEAESEDVRKKSMATFDAFAESWEFERFSRYIRWLLIFRGSRLKADKPEYLSGI